MSYINQITLQGNLGKDAETKHTPDGTPVTTFSMATRRAPAKARTSIGTILWSSANWLKRPARYVKAIRSVSRVRFAAGLTRRTAPTARSGKCAPQPSRSWFAIPSSRGGARLGGHFLPQGEFLCFC